MVDQRVKILARNLIQYSCRLQKDEKVLIEAVGIDETMVLELIKAAYAVGAKPIVWLKNSRIERQLMLQADEGTLCAMAEADAAVMAQMDAYIGIRGGGNASEMSDVPPEQMEKYQTVYWEPVHGQIRVPKTKWVVLRYPTGSMAQLANTSTESFENYYFAVCNLDYAKMSAAMEPLVELMEKTDKVRIVGPGTDLSFSIKGIPAVKCDGLMNIPDGEVYTAPVRESVNGVISYNTPSLEAGYTFENIVFEFKDGKIVKATANDNKRINALLDTDEGGRYLGEFSFGLNPYINRPMKDTLFDEKIAGSIHLTPGSCYDDAFNGNRSAVHWDLVLIQTPEYGGGEIYFDDVLIRKDGRFVIPELDGLNPENLR